MDNAHPTVGCISTNKRQAVKAPHHATAIDPKRDKEANGYSGITTRRRSAMFRHSKIRQAGLILFATTLLLIVPNLTRLFG
ncbi:MULTISPECIES: hypothetical protein [Pseudomonas]|uniref:Uncharacterized protein n=1 Tax=Pseudomonas juntendi TaxID=2666183 RepID=A0A7W2LRF5_9PSED|nr:MULTISPECIES: hypothetical protein [Pseudomonas]QEQ87129.1 hypothetical protein F1602_07215 [Pseudomonas putida]MBA6095643.1 hypothetical protein [Pseudomonas juntendi]MBA6145551.1 hypothetical protein [Pseudomonas juntendi]WBM35468.1 hypothetical protein M2J80_07290 [Pseudomonas sp. NY11382]WDM61756.1 hypothetical protein K4A76_06770 [Pseudomonas sp. NEEL19]